MFEAQRKDLRRIVEAVPDLGSKFYAATQVMDEARLVEDMGVLDMARQDLEVPMSQDEDIAGIDRP